MKSGLPIDIQVLLSKNGMESLRVEYKATWNHVCGGAALRTICAFANDLVNVNGGYLIVGVEEDEGVPVLPPQGIPEADLERMQKEIQGEINRIRPVYTPMIVPERVGNTWLLVIVCPGGDARPYEAPERLGEKASRHPYVRTNNQTREATGDLLRQLHEVSTRVPFDDRARYDAAVGDISPALVQHHLHQIRSRLAEEGVDSAERYRKMQLLKPVNSHEVPRNVALLFFSEDPTRWFRGANIEIAHLPKGRAGDEIIERRVSGPLGSQIRTALDHLRGMMPVEVRKHADRAESDRIEAWPFAAVEEALVNAVHHRGYDVPDPIKVEILPDALRIVSYPGPVAGLSMEDLQAGDPPPVPARNRRIAELLKELDLAEARGTGLSRIRSEMARNGSPAPRFRFDPDRTWFEVLLPIHPEFLRVDERLAAALPSQPLRLGRPAPPDEVVGREELVAQVERALEHQSVILVGPPGRGVSSVLGACDASMRKRREVFAVDLDGASMDGLAAALLDWVEDQLGEMPLPAELEEVVYPPGRRRSKAMDVLDALLDYKRTRSVLLVLDNLGSFGVHSGQGHALQADLLDVLERHAHVRFLAATHAQMHLGPELLPRWLKVARLIAVPPLARFAGSELACRLLWGLGIDPKPATVDAMVALSSGLPSLLIRVVAHMHYTAGFAPDSPSEALDALVAEPGDPTGLRHRIDDFRCRFLQDEGVDSVTAALLDGVAPSPPGIRRSDLIAAVVTASRSRTQVLTALRDLELDGWLVEVDGVIRFEHPWIRDAWVTERPPPPRAALVRRE